ncbi:hypothetical protein [Pseudomonas amygdali]|uniref:hypothetical protein n=1 Tax=Pseudomonas amygdali TaxID=47877 RepID=UPI001F44A8DA|nr:hypothetical protein [Pseudomonas amygdali]
MQDDALVRKVVSGLDLSENWIRFDSIRFDSIRVYGGDAVQIAELESEVWQHAARSYGRPLAELIRVALRSYARPPGLDDLTRLYRSSIGPDAFAALQACLAGDWGNDDPKADFLWLRTHKRDYLYYCVLKRLVCDHLASQAMRDSLFSADLGV